MWILLIILSLFIFAFLFSLKDHFTGASFECPSRNMSYDLRGEAYFQSKTNFPFNNSTIGPNNEQCHPKKSKIKILD